MKRQYVVIALAAISVVAAASALSSGLRMFLNPAGLLLVIGGSLVGVFIAFPLHTLRELWSQIASMRGTTTMDVEDLVALFSRLARIYRTEGVRALEESARAEGHQFLEMGVALVADEHPPVEIRERLEQEFDFYLSRREAQRSVLTLLGRLAPAFGLAGTMIGLIRMLHTVTDPSSVASAMSVALLTTFYGIMIANLVVLPLERKLKERNRDEAVEMTLVSEGILALANYENAAAISARLRSFRFAAPPRVRHSGNPRWAQVSNWASMGRGSGHGD